MIDQALNFPGVKSYKLFVKTLSDGTKSAEYETEFNILAYSERIK